MLDKSSSTSKSLAFNDLLIIFIPIWILLLARDSFENELFAALGRVAMIGLTIWLIRWRGGGFAKMGVMRPTKIIKTISLGFGLMVLGIIIGGTAQELLLSLPGMTFAESDLSRFADLEGNIPLLIFWLVNIWTTIAIGEELIWRAFLMDRLESIFGDGRIQDVLVVLISAAMFGLAHFYQGTIGIVVTGLLGLVYVLAYRLLKRNLWVVIIAHGLTDTLSIIFIYLGRM